MSEYFNKVQDDEFNKSEEKRIERSEDVDVREELKRIREEVRRRRLKMSPEERERNFNAIRDLNNKLEDCE